MLIVGVLPEELVLDESSACAEAPDSARIGWLVGRRCEGIAARGVLRAYGVVGVGIVGSPVGFPVVEVGRAMNFVAAAVGDRVDDATGCASIFSGEDTGVDLELADCLGRGGIGLAGTSALFRVVGLIVVGAVDQNVVEDGADTANADQTKAAAVGDNAGGGHGEARPAEVVHWHTA